MKVGVFTVILRSIKLEQVLDYLCSLGVQSVEIGAGGYAGTDHCNVDALLGSARKVDDFLAQIASRRMKVSSLSCHGNPLHPNRRIAAQHDQAFRKTVRLAKRLGVSVVTTFS